MLRGGPIAFLLTTMPFAALTAGAGDRAERAFHDVGALLAEGVSFVAQSAASAKREAPQNPSASEVVAEPQSEGGHRGAPAKARKGRRGPGELSVHVGEARLLELARMRAVPRGQSVPEKGPRPAGIALYGVSGLGVGLRDGDVLTAVEGRPVQAEGQVIGVVLGVLARHARRITGEFWRGTERGSIVVDLPIVSGAP